MIRAIAIAAVLAFTAGSVLAAAFELDAKGNCHDKAPGAKNAFAPKASCVAPAKKGANCKKGNPCGNTCIPMDKECHIK